MKTTKKAFLAEFLITTRITADVKDDCLNWTADPELQQKAIDKILTNPAGYVCGDNITCIYEDRECPYGTLDGETAPVEERHLKVCLDLVVRADRNASEDELIEKARRMIAEDGLADYINKNNIVRR